MNVDMESSRLKISHFKHGFPQWVNERCGCVHLLETTSAIAVGSRTVCK